MSGTSGDRLSALGMTSVRRQPKWDTRAGLAKVQIGGLPKSIGVWDSGRGQTKGGSVHGEGYREGNQAGDAA